MRVGRGAGGRTARLGLGVVGALLLTLPSPATGQAWESRLGAGALWQSFTFDDVEAAAAVETLTLLTVPVGARARLAPWATLDVAGAWADGTLETADGTTASVSGFTDTRVSLTFGTPSGPARVALIGLLPTGETEQTLAESRVAGALAADLLPFAVSNWGSGGGAGVNVSLTRSLGAVGVGVSASYLARQSFEPLVGEAFAYRPGDLLQLSAAVDGAVGGSGKATLRATYNRYGEDEVDERNLFQTGDRFQVMGSWAFPVGTGSSGIAYAGIVHREEGSFLDGVETLSSQDLLLLGGGLRIPTAGVVIQPDVQGRLFRRADGADQGWDVGGTVELEVPTGAALLVPSAGIHVGRLEIAQGVESPFVGFEVGLATRFGGGR